MKKLGIMNKEISSVIAGMGHNDTIFVCGSAFPIPTGERRIDLALEPGLPGFIDVIRVILKELEVEKFIVSRETLVHSKVQFEKICDLMPEKESIVVEQMELKDLGHTTKAYIRTGECTPFSNVILVSGVIF